MKLKIKLLLIMTMIKNITTQEFNKLAAENFIARLAQANLARKSNIANLEKKTGFNVNLKN